jgi:hypothetical protein
MTELSAMPNSGKSWIKLRGLLWASLLVIIALWVVLGIVTQFWLGIRVPLTDADVSSASWLGSPTTALHFSTGPMAYAVTTALCFMGVAEVILRRNWFSLIFALLLSSAAWVGASETAVMRIGILDDTIKLGCFVETSAECRDMLGLPKSGAVSMYAGADHRMEHSGMHAAWYIRARDAMVSQSQENRSIWTTMPGLAIIRAPVYLFDADTLQNKVLFQRKQLKQLRENNPFLVAK